MLVQLPLSCGYTVEDAVNTTQHVRCVHVCGMQVDNLSIHEVRNVAAESRVHLVADVAERSMPERVRLQPGQVCEYASTAEKAQESPGC
jgi:hypothetical protein